MLHTSTPRVVGQGRAKFQRRLGQSQEFLNSPEIRAAGRVEGAQSRLQAGSMKDLVEGEDPEAGQGEQEKLVQEEGQVLGLAAARAGEAAEEEEQASRVEETGDTPVIQELVIEQTDSESDEQEEVQEGGAEDGRGGIEQEERDKVTEERRREAREARAAAWSEELADLGGEGRVKEGQGVAQEIGLREEEPEEVLHGVVVQEGGETEGQYLEERLQDRLLEQPEGGGDQQVQREPQAEVYEHQHVEQEQVDCGEQGLPELDQPEQDLPQLEGLPALEDDTGGESDEEDDGGRATKRRR